ncbi:uncharacterized protein BX663DRAFT_488458 [Cokeromyces recurvatus]|uniref:uncharacterized protein n=1 Tax=Cokeromyces recurvatus TaxID=90255 RepID=UPI00221F2583|nr:uncharacterized protein BX663DRAFT_488458 [Cokeromyces recurvatus]KAI7900245.1 hypothetical protein BX663DRAFT_488458 [Cokeromyces recurvatus]
MSVIPVGNIIDQGIIQLLVIVNELTKIILVFEDIISIIPKILDLQSISAQNYPCQMYSCNGQLLYSIYILLQYEVNFIISVNYCFFFNTRRILKSMVTSMLLLNIYFDTNYISDQFSAYLDI